MINESKATQDIMLLVPFALRIYYMATSFGENNVHSTMRGLSPGMHTAENSQLKLTLVRSERRISLPEPPMNQPLVSIGLTNTSLTQLNETRL